MKNTEIIVNKSLTASYFTITTNIDVKNKKKNLTSKILSGAGYSPKVFFITVSLAFLKTKSLTGPTESGTLCDKPKTKKVEDTTLSYSCLEVLQFSLITYFQLWSRLSLIIFILFVFKTTVELLSFLRIFRLIFILVLPVRLWFLLVDIIPSTFSCCRFFN